METPARFTFNLDGSNRVFPIATLIKGDNYCRIEVDGVIINDRSKYDIVNNSIVFLSVADVPAASQLDVLVVQSEEAIGQLAITTNIDIVASNIANINTVGGAITNVNNVGSNIANVNTVVSSIATVNTVATNIADVNSVATNMAEVLLADTNAATATAQAGIATTQASNASTSATNASNSAGASSTSATNASNSASAASASATAASGSASSASTFATNASNSASAASTSASNASTSASAADASAISAAQSLATFQGQYHGALASAPVSGVDTGDIYFDITLSSMRVYSGTAWVAAASSVNGTTTRQSFTATASQTVFTTSGYDSTYADVYLNGVKLVNGVDVDVTNGTTFTLTVGATAGDSVDFIGYGAFDVADTVSKSTGGSFDGAVAFTAKATGTVTTDNDLSFDMNTTNNFKCTPIGTGTLTFTNITSGQSGNIWLDNSGGHAISASATTYISSADLTTISTAGVYFMSYYADGTNVLVSVSRALTSAGA